MGFELVRYTDKLETNKNNAEIISAAMGNSANPVEGLCLKFLVEKEQQFRVELFNF